MERRQGAALAFLARFEAFREKVLRPTLLEWREWVHPRAMGFLLPALERLRTRRREEGFLTYEDLLLIVPRPPARLARPSGAYFRSRFSHLLVDEFQDTDPLQAEMHAAYLTRSDDDGRRTWRQLVPRPGSLFVVGDPKQSIYRFRRADIATYVDVHGDRDRLGRGGPALDANFRPSPRARARERRFAGVFPKKATKRQAAFAPLEARGAERGRRAAPSGSRRRATGTSARTACARQRAERRRFRRTALAGGWKIPAGPKGAPVTPRASATSSS